MLDRAAGEHWMYTYSATDNARQQSSKDNGMCSVGIPSERPKDLRNIQEFQSRWLRETLKANLNSNSACPLMLTMQIAIHGTEALPITRQRRSMQDPAHGVVLLQSSSPAGVTCHWWHSHFRTEGKPIWSNPGDIGRSRSKSWIVSNIWSP